MIILGALRPFAAPLPFNFGDVLVVGIVAFAPQLVPRSSSGAAMQAGQMSLAPD